MCALFFIAFVHSKCGLKVWSDSARARKPKKIINAMSLLMILSVSTNHASNHDFADSASFSIRREGGNSSSPDSSAHP